MKSGNVTRWYQGRWRSQKCTPIQPCNHEDNHQDRLLHRSIGPQHVEDEGVRPVHAKLRAEPARADDVHHQPRGNQHAEPNLHHLPSGHSKAAAPVELVDHQRDVDQQGAVKKQLTRWSAPDRAERFEANLHRLERDDAEGVIGQVGGEKDHQHQARGDTQFGCRLGAAHREGAEVRARCPRARGGQDYAARPLVRKLLIRRENAPGSGTGSPSTIRA